MACVGVLCESSSISLQSAVKGKPCKGKGNDATDVRKANARERKGCTVQLIRLLITP